MQTLGLIQEILGDMRGAILPQERRARFIRDSKKRQSQQPRAANIPYGVTDGNDFIKSRAISRRCSRYRSLNDFLARRSIFRKCRGHAIERQTRGLNLEAGGTFPSSGGKRDTPVGALLKMGQQGRCARHFGEKGCIRRMMALEQLDKSVNDGRYLCSSGSRPKCFTIAWRATAESVA